MAGSLGFRLKSSMFVKASGASRARRIQDRSGAIKLALTAVALCRHVDYQRQQSLPVGVRAPLSLIVSTWHAAASAVWPAIAVAVAVYVVVVGRAKVMA